MRRIYIDHQTKQMWFVLWKEREKKYFRKKLGKGIKTEFV